jgi:hypothetical protein
MKKKMISTMLCFLLTFSTSTPSRADMFGGDLVILAQILSNAVQQLIQLKQILNSGQDTLGLIRSINDGINNALNLYKTAFPNADPGIYKDWEKAQDGIRKLEALYGIITPSPVAQIQRDTDQSAAEAIALNNSIYDYSKEIDEIGEQIKNLSHDVSPKGADKLQAQTLGVMLHVLNQSLRAQGTSLKLQAQGLALQNHHEKEFTRHMLSTSGTLSQAMKDEKARFTIPRF